MKNINMRPAARTAALAVLTLACAGAPADSLTVVSTTARGESREVKLPYAIEIVSVKDCRLVYRRGASAASTPFTQIAEIEVDGFAELNDAEKLAAAGKWNKAVKAYGAAGQATHVLWKKRLVTIRRLRALNRAGAIDEAVKAWLKLIEVNAAAQGALALRPNILAEKGAACNDVAIGLLNSALKKRFLKSSPLAVEAVEELLKSLYERQGRGDKVKAIAARLSSRPRTAQRPRPLRRGTSLLSLKAMIEAGQAREALAVINPRLRSYSPAQLPTALLLRGKAQIILAGQTAPQKRALLLDGALDLMRVVSQFPGSDEAPEALLAAARMHMLLARPNTTAARKACEALVKGYPSSPQADQARKMLVGAE
ncbi:MAG: hypothetical protein J7M14_02490 [Planctomycetes bacterium]|nr:hypothetical protein [Planctomycetota bacterium]